MSFHGREVKRDQEEEEDDQVDSMLRKIGCLEINNNLSFCYAEHSDWRKCQAEVKALRECHAGQGRNIVEKAEKEEE